ncbi:MAG: response regulator transcription factor [Burkholderiales bacterium]
MSGPVTRDSRPAVKKVLIADDEPNIVVSLEFLLQQGGYEVRTVSNGNEALRAAREFRPHLLLLDIMLPLRSGFEVCQLIRESPELKELKIIMLTAKGREAEVAKGLALGADAYITKPFATRELLETVRRMLGK